MDVGQPSQAARPATLPPPRRGIQFRRRLRLVAVVVVVLALLAGGGFWLHRALTVVVLDDARIAGDMISLASRVPGWVTEVRVIAGDAAARGTLLVRIDDRDSRLNLQEIEARLASLTTRQAELEARLAMVDRQTSSQRAAQQARLEVARAALAVALSERGFAEAEFGRAGQLIGSGAATRQRYDQVRTTLETARQKVLSATAEISNAEALLAVAEAAREEMQVLRRQLEALEPQRREITAQRDRALLDLRDRSIVMPFDGTVDRRFVDPGEYVTAGQRLLLLHDPSEVRVEANVKETEIRYFHPGTRVKVTVDAYPGRRFEGVVERVITAATSEFALLPTPNPSGNFTKITQRLPIRIRLRELPRDGALRPGMMVLVEAVAREGGAGE